MSYRSLKTFSLSQWLELMKRTVRDQVISIIWNFIVYFITAFLHIKALVPINKNLPWLPGIRLYAYNTLFWLSAGNELVRNGIKGKSQSAGDGDFELVSWWFYTPVSLYAFRYLGVGLSFICISTSPLGFFYHFENSVFIGIAITYSFFSLPIVFSMAFVVGRYHAMAWMIFPLAISLGYHGNLSGLAFAMIFIALTSSSVLFVTAALVVVLALVKQDVLIITALIPGITVALGYVIYLFSDSKEGIKKIGRMLSAIGMLKKKKVKYKRNDIGNFSGLDLWYFFSCIFYLIVAAFTFTEIPYLFLMSILMFIVNSLLARFSDTQTLEYMIVVVGLFELSRYAVNDFAILAVLPLFCQAYLHKTGVGKEGGNLGILKPLDIIPELNQIQVLFNNIDKGAKVYIPFHDPNGCYSKLFNGYRHSIELPIYLGSLSNTNVFPNWSMIFKYNYEESPDIWSNNELSIIKRCEEWGADYILLDTNEYDFKIVDKYCYSLGQFVFDADNYDIWSKNYFKTPNWLLLKRKNQDDNK